MRADEAALLLRLFTEIGIIDQLATARAEQLLPPGISMAQYRVLNHLLRLGGQWSPARLARAFQQTRQTMTVTLQRMEAAGLVESRADPDDRRSRLVVLSPHGEAMFGQCTEALAPALAETWALLPDGLVNGLLPLMVRLREVLDAARG